MFASETSFISNGSSSILYNFSCLVPKYDVRSFLYEFRFRIVESSFKSKMGSKSLANIQLNNDFEPLPERNPKHPGKGWGRVSAQSIFEKSFRIHPLPILESDIPGCMTLQKNLINRNGIRCSPGAVDFADTLDWGFCRSSHSSSLQSSSRLIDESFNGINFYFISQFVI